MAKRTIKYVWPYFSILHERVDLQHWWIQIDHSTIISWLPSLHLLVQIQQWKHQNNLWNLFKVNNKAPERHRSSVFIIKFEQISHIGLVILMFPLLTLNKGHSIITLSQNAQIWTPLPPCSHLFNFGCSPPPLPPYRRYLHHHHSQKQ